MENLEGRSALSTSNVESSEMAVKSFRLDRKSYSERREKRKRWSPYSKRRKLLPKKSFSLETITPRTPITRIQSFELAQSTEDFSAVEPEAIRDLEERSSNVSETSQASEWPFSTNYVGFSLYPENESQSGMFKHGEFDPSLKPESITLSNTNEPSQQEPANTETKTSRPFTEWILWCAYAKLMKLAWRNTREDLCEQTHRAENYELQAKSTMAQVLSMKSQLKSDICEMKDQVKKIQSMRAMLDSAKKGKDDLQSENDKLKAKIEYLCEERVKLSREISITNHAIEEYKAKVESMKELRLTCDDEIAELKAEKIELDKKIQELLPLSEQVKHDVTVGRKNLHNRRLEIHDIEKELSLTKGRINMNKRMSQTFREQAQLVRKEIDVASEGGKVLRHQLWETRNKVIDMDSLIAELSLKVSSAANQMSNAKKESQVGKGKIWRRFRLLPEDSRSLFSIQL